MTSKPSVFIRVFPEDYCIPRFVSVVVGAFVLLAASNMLANILRDACFAFAPEILHFVHYVESQC